MGFAEININMPVNFESGGYFVSDGEWIHPTRTIDSSLLLFGISGQAHISSNGKEFTLEKGDIMFLPAGQAHGGYEPSQNVSFFWLHFHPNVLQTSINLQKGLPVELPPNGIALVPEFLGMPFYERLSVLATQLLAVYEAPHSQPMHKNYLLSALLLEINQQYREILNRNLNTKKDNLYRICEWIRINIDKPISLQHVAEEFGYNKNYLCRMFKNHLGVSVQEYIINLKISHIKHYLCTTNKSVKEIAFMLGFSDEKYMMRLFKKSEMLSPVQFRKAYMRTHMNKK